MANFSISSLRNTSKSEPLLELAIEPHSSYIIVTPFFRKISTPMNPLLQRITIDGAICHGKPTIRGLRYPVAMILELLSSGMSTESILSDYEDLEHENILAVLLWASKVSNVISLEPLTSRAA